MSCSQTRLTSSSCFHWLLDSGRTCRSSCKINPPSLRDAEKPAARCTSFLCRHERLWCSYTRALAFRLPGPISSSIASQPRSPANPVELQSSLHCSVPEILLPPEENSTIHWRHRP